MKTVELLEDITIIEEISKKPKSTKKSINDVENLYFEDRCFHLNEITEENQEL